ncbi:MAG TPA: glycine dehydrogenase (aminomethyl-transferring), partial [Polyangia bacterium]|nr:glycine dehydrogenase (aminomethyl-transferring) [Polyangia bacterium]
MAVDLESKDRFASRHIGPDDADVAEMLAALGVSSLDALVAQTVPADIRLGTDLKLPPAVTEAEVLAELRALSEKNQIWRSYLGQGYSDCVTPPVVLRNIIENPGWYTQYTPYQAEISQGRLEALLNYQTLVTDLTGLPVANASLLDEGTAAAEAMHMLAGVAPAAQGEDGGRAAFVVSAGCHPQTIEVVRTRAKPLGVEVVVVTDVFAFDFTSQPVFGVLAQYPATDGALGTAAAWRGLC